MKTLIVEDDFTSSLLLQGILKPYGTSHTALNGNQAVEAVRAALEEAKEISPVKGARIVMTTALEDSKNILASFKGLCDVYLTKPVDKAKLLGELRKLRLIE